MAKNIDHVLRFNVGQLCNLIMPMSFIGFPPERGFLAVLRFLPKIVGNIRQFHFNIN